MWQTDSDHDYSFCSTNFHFSRNSFLVSGSTRVEHEHISKPCTQSYCLQEAAFYKCIAAREVKL